MLGPESRVLSSGPYAVDILYLLIPLSIVLVLLIGAVFWWSLESGQFDDLEGPAHRILQDDDDALPSARSLSAESAAPAPAQHEQRDSRQPGEQQQRGPRLGNR